MLFTELKMVEIRYALSKQKILNMVKKKFISVFFIVLFILGCQTNSRYFENECNCFENEPYNVYVNIFFSRTEQTPNPTIWIMAGEFGENNIIDTIFTDTINNNLSHTEYELALNSNYTICAEYLSGQDTIIVIDGGFLSKTHTPNCDSGCWKIMNKNFNVELIF